MWIAFSLFFPRREVKGANSFNSLGAESNLKNTKGLKFGSVDDKLAKFGCRLYLLICISIFKLSSFRSIILLKTYFIPFHFFSPANDTRQCADPQIMGFR